MSRYYLAFLGPLIREVSTAEVSSLHRRAWRTITTTQRVLGLLTPSYGVFTSQEEIQSLSIVLERHMNTIVTAMQIDLYPIPDWIPPYDDVDLGTQLK